MDNTVDISKLFENKTLISSPTEEFNFNDVQITVKKTINLQEMLMFVRDAVKSCFDDDMVQYVPEGYDFGIKSCVLMYYTNVELPSAIEDRYALLYNTDLIDEVISRINDKQLCDIVRTIDKKIKYINKSNLETGRDQVNKLLSALGAITEAFDKIDVGDLDAIINSITDGSIDPTLLVRAFDGMKNTKE